MEFRIAVRDPSGAVKRIPFTPSNGLAVLSAFAPAQRVFVITPSGHIWTIEKTLELLHWANGDESDSLSE